MKVLQKVVAVWLLAATAMAFPPQQAKSVIPLSTGQQMRSTPVADLAWMFGLSAPPWIDAALNRGATVALSALDMRHRVIGLVPDDKVAAVGRGVGIVRDRAALFIATRPPTDPVVISGQNALCTMP